MYTLNKQKLEKYNKEGLIRILLKCNVEDVLKAIMAVENEIYEITDGRQDDRIRFDSACGQNSFTDQHDNICAQVNEENEKNESSTIYVDSRMKLIGITRDDIEKLRSKEYQHSHPEMVAKYDRLCGGDDDYGIYYYD